MSAQTPEIGDTSRNSRANVTTASQNVNVTACVTNVHHNTYVDTPAECTLDDGDDEDMTFMTKVAISQKTDTSATTNVEANSAAIKLKRSRRKSTLKSFVSLTCERGNVHTTFRGTHTSGNLDSIDNEHASSLENKEMKEAVNQLNSNLNSQTERSNRMENEASKYKEQLEKKDKTESNLSDLKHKLSKATPEAMVMKETNLETK